MIRVGVDAGHKFYERIVNLYPRLGQKNAKGELIKFNQWFTTDWSLHKNWGLFEILRIIHLDNERDIMF